MDGPVKSVVRWLVGLLALVLVLGLIIAAAVWWWKRRGGGFGLGLGLGGAGGDAFGGGTPAEAEAPWWWPFPTGEAKEPGPTGDSDVIPQPKQGGGQGGGGQGGGEGGEGGPIEELDLPSVEDFEDCIAATADALDSAANLPQTYNAIKSLITCEIKEPDPGDLIAGEDITDADFYGRWFVTAWLRAATGVPDVTKSLYALPEEWQPWMGLLFGSALELWDKVHESQASGDGGVLSKAQAFTGRVGVG